MPDVKSILEALKQKFPPASTFGRGETPQELGGITIKSALGSTFGESYTPAEQYYLQGVESFYLDQLKYGVPPEIVRDQIDSAVAELESARTQEEQDAKDNKRPISNAYVAKLPLYKSVMQFNQKQLEDYTSNVATNKRNEQINAMNRFATLDQAKQYDAQVRDMRTRKAAEQVSLAKSGAFNTPPEQPAGFQTPEMPTGEPLVSDFLNRLAPNVRGFYESNLSSILNPISGARSAWWKALNEPRQAESEANIEEQAAATALANQAGENVPDKLNQFSPEAAQRAKDVWFNFLTANNPEYQTARKEAAGKRATANAFVPPEDPLAAYLKDFPWQEQWLKIPAAQRGFNAARSAPAARWSF